MSGTAGFVVSRLYGTGMRLMEGLRFRVKDVGIEQRELTLGDGKCSHDRLTVLPENLVLPLQSQIAKAMALRLWDLKAGVGRVWVPDALAVKYPHAALSRGWKWVFSSSNVSKDARTGLRLRHYMNGTTIQNPSLLRPSKQVSPNHARRTSCASPLPPISRSQANDIRTLQELLGRSEVSTAMIYTHVPNHCGRGTRSRLDQI